MGRPSSGLEFCSFCGKSKDEVKRLIGGMNGTSICFDCVRICYDMVESSFTEVQENELPEAEPLGKIRNLTPKKVKEFFDQYIIGQELAKKYVAVAVYNHYKRIVLQDSEIEKSNLLFIGPTGTGKTLLAKTIAKILDVPMVIVDATSFTEAGYVGDDVENILYYLYVNSGYDLSKTQVGVVYIDEIDKISRKSGEYSSSTRDVSGEGVQYALLKIVESNVVYVPTKGRRGSADTLYIDTSNILFIAGGAFSGIEEIIRNRLGKSKIGFKTSKHNKNSSNEEGEIQKEDVYKYIKSEDLIKFGIIPELVGRFPVIVPFHPLTQRDLERILIEPKNSILKQYIKLFEVEGINLVFTDDAIKEIVKVADVDKVGARGLRAAVDKIMLNIMFESPEVPNLREVIINADTIRTGKPIYIEGKRKKIVAM